MIFRLDTQVSPFSSVNLFRHCLASFEERKIRLDEGIVRTGEIGSPGDLLQAYDELSGTSVYLVSYIFFKTFGVCVRTKDIVFTDFVKRRLNMCSLLF